MPVKPKSSPAPDTEASRLAELRDLGVLDTPPEPEFDDLVETASLIAGTPIALMTLVDEDRQWFKARRGLDVEETPREVAFCSTAIETPGQPLIVRDANADPRFADNPLVTGDPKIAFYAGVPIVTSEGHALGTICVIDDKPGELSQEQIDALTGISRQAAALLELRRRTRNLSAILDQERRGRNGGPSDLEAATLRGALAQAIRDREFTLVYMPVVELESGRTLGAESLVRFTGPQFGNASTEDLVALAEADGLVGDIDAMVMDRALEEFAAGRVDAPSVGVNISPVAIGPGLPDQVRSALDRNGVTADCFVVEITERAVLGNNAELKTALEALATMGVRIAVDDFGAGATSIADLRSLPFDILKLDRGLVGDVDGADTRRTLMIIQALAGMASSLGIQTVAEGIETARERDLLEQAGVTAGQGHLFGRPAPAGQARVPRDPSELGADRPVSVQMERLAGTFFENSPDMACVGTNDYLLRANENWERVLGWTEEEMLGRPLIEFIHPEDAGRAVELMEALGDGEPLASHEVRFATPAGDWRILDWNARRDPATGLVLATARDVTREREAERERDRLRTVMEVLTELQEQYIEQGTSRDWWHRALDSIIELSGSEYGFVGRVEHDENNDPYLISYAVTNIAWNDWSRGVYEEFKDGGLEFHNLKTLFGVTLATGELVIANDAPHDPRRGGLPEGHPALNHYVGVPFMSEDGIVGMAGLANRPGGYDEGLVDELAPIFASLGQIISRDIERRRARQIEFDASSTSAAVEAVLDSEGVPHAMEIVRRAVEAVEPGARAELYVIGESRERLSLYGGNSGPSGILHREACLGLTRGEPHVSRPGDDPRNRCSHAGPDSITICVPVDTPDEEYGVVIAGLGAEATESSSGAESIGRLVPALETLSSAVAEVARREDLSHRALADPLTGLPNRSAFIQSVNRSLDTVVRDGACFAVMMLDLDNFKAVNDTLGHQAGDLVLEEAGQRIADVLRDSDTVARLGGDEFGVVVSDCGKRPELLARACERVRCAVAEIPVAQGLGVTASVGAVEVAGGGASWDEIYRVADLELYAAKKDGGNRVQVSAERLD